MQQLHLVGFTTESDHLILSAKKGAKSGSFVVPLDERLLEVIAEAVRRRNASGGDEALTTPPELLPPPEAPKRTSLLSPREIQARLRAGRTIAQVAREAATDEEWVAKFAPPVLAERGRIVSRVRDLVFTKPRRGESAEALGLSVRWNLADRGVRLIDDEYDACWSAFHVGDTLWGITFDFVSRGRRQTAEWEVDLADDVLVARNRTASDLAYIEPGRRRRLTLTPEPSDRDTKKRRAGDNGPAQAASTPAPRSARPSPRVTAKRSTKSVKAAAKVTKASKAATSATKSAARVARPAKASKTPSRTSAAASKKKATARTGKAARSTGAVAKKGRGAKRAARPRAPGPAAPIAVAAAPVPVVAPAAPARQPQPSGNELARRRLEMVRAGSQRTPAPSRTAPRRPAPEPPRQRPQASPRPVEPTRSATTGRTVEGPGDGAPRRRRDGDVDAAAAPRPSRRAAEPAAPEPAASDVATGEAADAIAATEELVRARREERRRARAERLAQAPRSSLPSAQLPPDSAIPSDDGRVVTIRANRAGGGDVVVPGGPRPLRPAQPAAQPKRKRFTRTR